MQAVLQRAASAAQIILALDLDGTLIPFAPTPQEARIEGEVAALLDELGALPSVTAAVITGRPRALVEDLPPRFPSFLIAAEHGAWRYADGQWVPALPAIPQLDEIEALLTQLAARHPGALVERKSCSVCLHWRRVDAASREQIVSAAETIVDEWLETHQQLERLPVTEALEVRHRMAHKGTGIAWLRERGPAGAPVIALGDDITDEDMFVSLREGDIGILVSAEPRRTQAGLRLPSPAAVHRFLRWLIDVRRDVQAHAPEELVAARTPRRAPDARLVIASNRLPAAPSADRQREVGGLVSALMPVLTETSGIWLGWSGAERDPGLRLRIEDTEAYTRAQFDYPPTWRQRFYVGFCNQSLWPLLHGFPERVRYLDDEWQCYVDANRAYAQLTQEAAGADALVWIQDFHLMLVARELRRAGHRGQIGFFLHVPFPPLDVLETMPWATDVMAALLEFDRIGLQASRWHDNFMACARGLLGAEGEARARDRAGVFPIGIDPDRFAESAASASASSESGAATNSESGAATNSESGAATNSESGAATNSESGAATKSEIGPATKSEIGAVEAMLGGRQLILGVDRLDYSKGIPERLEAFARLLERFPEWRGKVSFIQVSVPTRSEVPEYAELRSRVELLVGRINGAYGEADWVPVRYLYRSYDQATLALLYRQAAVGLVTPLRDGMNLVAKEYVASQDPANPGVLVLSRFCGAAERMTLAQLTNPYHTDGVAADLDAALRMPHEERVARHAALRAVVWSDTASAWAKSFLDSLKTT